MNKANKAVFDINAQCCDITNNLIKKTTEPTIRINPLKMGEMQCIIPIPNGYKFVKVDNDKQQVIFIKTRNNIKE